MGTFELCPHGCYWDCEHRAPSPHGDVARLMPVEDAKERALNHCRDCGDYFYDVLDHTREHARKRQLGWLPERFPQGWR